MNELDVVLTHYGVKGMHWGTRSNAPAPTEDHVRTADVKTRAKNDGLKTLSNKELQDAINRMNLEQQYKRLNPSKTKKGLQFAADILLGVGKQQLIRVVSDIAGKQVDKAIKKG